MRYVVWSRSEFEARKTVGTLLHFTATHGHPPTLRELAEARGYTSSADGNRLAQNAVKLGLLRHEPGRSRGYSVP